VDGLHHLGHVLVGFGDLLHQRRPRGSHDMDAALAELGVDGAALGGLHGAVAAQEPARAVTGAAERRAHGLFGADQDV